MPLTAWLPSFDLALSCSGTRNDTLSSGKTALEQGKTQRRSTSASRQEQLFCLEFCVLRSWNSTRRCTTRHGLLARTACTDCLHGLLARAWKADANNYRDIQGGMKTLSSKDPEGLTFSATSPLSAWMWVLSHISFYFNYWELRSHFVFNSVSICTIK